MEKEELKAKKRKVDYIFSSFFCVGCRAKAKNRI
jgi:hypothetical protein